MSEEPLDLSMKSCTLSQNAESSHLSGASLEQIGQDGESNQNASHSASSYTVSASHDGEIYTVESSPVSSPTGSSNSSPGRLVINLEELSHLNERPLDLCPAASSQSVATIEPTYQTGSSLQSVVRLESAYQAASSPQSADISKTYPPVQEHANLFKRPLDVSNYQVISSRSVRMEPASSVRTPSVSINVHTQHLPNSERTSGDATVRPFILPPALDVYSNHMMVRMYMSPTSSHLQSLYNSASLVGFPHQTLIPVTPTTPVTPTAWTPTAWTPTTPVTPTAVTTSPVTPTAWTPTTPVTPTAVTTSPMTPTSATPKPSPQRKRKPEATNSADSNGASCASQPKVRNSGNVNANSDSVPQSPPSPAPNEVSCSNAHGQNASASGVTKDEAYLELRRRNNKAAKKSRDARRQLEMDTAARLKVLEAEHVALLAEVRALTSYHNRLQNWVIGEHLGAPPI